MLTRKCCNIKTLKSRNYAQFSRFFLLESKCSNAALFGIAKQLLAGNCAKIAKKTMKKKNYRKLLARGIDRAEQLKDLFDCMVAWTRLLQTCFHMVLILLIAFLHQFLWFFGWICSRVFFCELRGAVDLEKCDFEV